MPFARATLTQLRDDVLQDTADQQIYDTTTQQLVDVTMFQQSPLKCMGYGTTGGVYTGYGYLDYLANFCLTPWNATGEYAVGWGALKGITQKPATYAAATQTIGGVAGTDIPLGTAVSRSDGFTYATTADVSIGSAGTATIQLQATTLGAAGNAMTGIQLQLTNAIAGVTSPFTASSAFTGGADIEDPAAFKARYLQAYADPAAGGSQNDYVQWAEAVPGVTRAWCIPNGMGAGTVIVYTMFDVAEAAAGGFPQGIAGGAASETRITAATGDLLAVANYIYPLRPVTALVYSVAPTADPINFVLNNLGTANTPTNLAAIEAALTAMFLSVGSPMGDASAIIYPNAWEGAIASVPGVSTFTVTSPAVPIAPTIGQMPVLGTVTVAS